MFGCGVGVPASHGGMGSVVVLLLRARARLGSPRNGFWSKHIKLRVQKAVVKMVVFGGLERVLGSGFGAFVLNYVFKRCSEMWCVLVVRRRFWDRVLCIRIQLRVHKEVQK